MGSTEKYSLQGKRVWVAGHKGMAGSAIVRPLVKAATCSLWTAKRGQSEVEEWMAATRPQAALVAAATVGGVVANDTRPAEFICDNLVIETKEVASVFRTRA